MGLPYSGVKLFLELWHRGFLKNFESVVDMGSQELQMPIEDFENLIKTYKNSKYQEENFSNLKNWPGIPKCSTKPFYEPLHNLQQF